jgi:hypothetical protein
VFPARTVPVPCPALRCRGEKMMQQPWRLAALDCQRDPVVCGKGFGVTVRMQPRAGTRQIVATQAHAWKAACAQLVHRALKLQFAGMQYAQMGGDLLDLTQQMAGHQHGHALMGGEVLQHAAQVGDAGRIFDRWSAHPEAKARASRAGPARCRVAGACPSSIQPRAARRFP